MKIKDRVKRLEEELTYYKESYWANISNETLKGCMWSKRDPKTGASISDEEYEKMKKKDWEVLAYADSIGVLWERVGDGFYWCKSGPHTEDQFQLCKIHKVKRLSDGEVFAVGNEVLVGLCDGKIREFVVDEGKVSCYIDKTKWLVGLISLVKIKQPILTTEDGFDKIHKSNTLFFVNSQWWTQESTVGNYIDMILEGDISRKGKFPTFNMKTNAQTYIDENKPQFSKKDMEKFAFAWRIETFRRPKATDPPVSLAPHEYLEQWMKNK